MKRLDFWTIVLLFAITLCGCSTDYMVNYLIGNWTCRIDSTEFLNENLGEAKSFFEFKDISFTMKLEFSDDGTYSFSFDEKSIQDMMEKTRETYAVGIEEYVEDLMIQRGYSNMSFENFLNALETDKDGLLDQMVEDMKSDFLDVIVPMEGKYRIEGNSLYLIDKNKGANSDGDKYVFQLSNDYNSLYISIDIQDMSYEELTSPLADFMPFTFERVR